MIRKIEPSSISKEGVVYKITLDFFFFFIRFRLPPEQLVYSTNYYFEIYRSNIDQFVKGYYHAITVSVTENTIEYTYYINEAGIPTSPVEELFYSDFVSCIKSQEFLRVLERVINEYVFSH